MGSIFEKDPIFKLFFYYLYKRYDDSFTCFRHLIENTKFTKTTMIKMIGDLKKGKSRFENNDLLIIMRGILHDIVNKNKRLAKNTLTEIISEKNTTYHQWFSHFYTTTKQFSYPNQLLILDYILLYMKVDSPS